MGQNPYPPLPDISQLTELGDEGVNLGHKLAQEIVCSNEQSHPLWMLAQAHVDGCQKCQGQLFSQH